MLTEEEAEPLPPELAEFQVSDKDRDNNPLLKLMQ